MSTPNPTLPSSTTTLCPITDLTIVCCHAIFLGGPTHGQSESEWLIEPFQEGETSTFVRHIKEGLRVLEKREGRGILVFSGGATKEERIRGMDLGLGMKGRTEGRGYYEIATHLLEIDMNSISNQNDREHGSNGSNTSIPSNKLEQYMFHEDYATDSYQNILLSLIQYPIWLNQLQDSSYLSTTKTMPTVKSPARSQPNPPSQSNLNLNLTLPRSLTIISHAFKRSRFLDLHLPAIRTLLPSSLQTQFDNIEITYIGIDPDLSERKMEEIKEGDKKSGYAVWEGDLFGNGDILSGKRRGRGWDEGVFLERVGGWFGEEDRRVVERLVSGEKG